MILSSLASIADRRASTPAAPFVAEEDGAARWGMAGAAAAARGMTGGGDAAFGSGFFHDGAAAGAGAALSLRGRVLTTDGRGVIEVVHEDSDADARTLGTRAAEEALAKGVPEAQFIARIHAELAQPRTCGVGYNSVRFDDEVTRFTLWRNFRDAYAREWQNGNSRWDLLDVARAFRALRPDGIEWPVRDDGQTSFRLEDLTAANGIEHGAAHDAMAGAGPTLPQLDESSSAAEEEVAEAIEEQEPEPELAEPSAASFEGAEAVEQEEVVAAMEEAAVAPVVDEPAASCTYTEDEILGWKVKELKAALKGAGLPVSGLKKVLQQRALENLL